MQSIREFWQSILESLNLQPLGVEYEERAMLTAYGERTIKGKYYRILSHLCVAPPPMAMVIWDPRSINQVRIWREVATAALKSHIGERIHGALFSIRTNPSDGFVVISLDFLAEGQERISQ
jgi:hypothetical protein